VTCCARLNPGIALGVLTAAVCALNLQPVYMGGSRLFSVRNAHSMIYDGDGGAVILFGGADSSRVRGDTWQWDSKKRTWLFVSASGP
jgi:Galactose oxidase, central domain